jgi:flagellar biosynthesis protein FliR
MKFIAALNSLNTPWLAIIVILIGMVYAVVSHIYGISGDGASGVIGAGIGLLTGQALAKSQQTSEPMVPIPLPTEPDSSPAKTATK